MSRALGLFMDALCVKDTDTGICRVSATVHRVNTVQEEQWCTQGEQRCMQGEH